MENIKKAVIIIIKAFERLFNITIMLVLTVAMLFGCYGVWDTLDIYKKSELSSSIMQYKPGDDTNLDAAKAFDELNKINPDVCAWLTVKGTNIDYPVVKGEDNLTYINRSVDLTFSLSGSIFLDYRNMGDFSDRYSVIYGHHMESKTMFGELPEFADQTYFDTHKSASLYTPEKIYSIEWYACIKTDAYDKILYNTTQYTDDAHIRKLLDYIDENAVCLSDMDVNESDSFIALSTCTTDTTDGRVVLIGRIS